MLPIELVAPPIDCSVVQVLCKLESNGHGGRANEREFNTPSHVTEEKKQEANEQVA